MVDVGRVRSSVPVPASRERGVNVLATIGVMVPVRVASGGIVACRVPTPETGMRAVPWDDSTVPVWNGTTSSSGSGGKNSDIRNQRKTIRASPTNNTSMNKRFSCSPLKKLLFTFTVLLIGPLSGPVAEPAEALTAL
jgi:hypothetical protein